MRYICMQNMSEIHQSVQKIWSRHEILTQYLTFEPQVWPWPWTDVAKCCALQIALMKYICMQTMSEILQGVQKIWSGHVILTQYLTFEPQVWPWPWTDVAKCCALHIALMRYIYMKKIWAKSVKASEDMERTPKVWRTDRWTDGQMDWRTDGLTDGQCDYYMPPKFLRVHKNVFLDVTFRRWHHNSPTFHEHILSSIWQ